MYRSSISNQPHILTVVMELKVLALLSLDVFRLSLGWALEELGHNVYYLNEIREDLIEQAIKVFKPDVFFDMGWDVEHCSKKKVAVLEHLLKKHNLYHVYFAEEDALHFERWSKPYVMQVRPQFVLTRSPQCISEYRGMGIEATYLDVGCNPRFHRKGPSYSKYACDVSIVANAQLVWEIYRRQSITDLVVPLLEEVINLKIWGRDWNQVESYLGVDAPRSDVWQGLIPFTETPWAYNSSIINVSIQSVENQVSNRTYDILSTGGFLLTSDTPGVREKIKRGVHCEVSASAEETKEKVHYYLIHDETRNRIAQAGRELAIRHLSYQSTLPAVWTLIENHLIQHKRMKTF